MGRHKSRAWSYDKYRYNKYVHAHNSGLIWKDSDLYDEVENYMLRHDTGLGSLVEKLLNNDFGHLRYSDQEYTF
jgi:hypothetical protein